MKVGDGKGDHTSVHCSEVGRVSAFLLPCVEISWMRFQYAAQQFHQRVCGLRLSILYESQTVSILLQLRVSRPPWVVAGVSLHTHQTHRHTGVLPGELWLAYPVKPLTHAWHIQSSAQLEACSKDNWQMQTWYLTYVFNDQTKPVVQVGFYTWKKIIIVSIRSSTAFFCLGWSQLCSNLLQINRWSIAESVQNSPWRDIRYGFGGILNAVLNKFYELIFVIRKSFPQAVSNF